MPDPEQDLEAPPTEEEAAALEGANLDDAQKRLILVQSRLKKQQAAAAAPPMGIPGIGPLPNKVMQQPVPGRQDIPGVPGLEMTLPPAMVRSAQAAQAAAPAGPRPIEGVESDFDLGQMAAPEPGRPAGVPQAQLPPVVDMALQGAANAMLMGGRGGNPAQQQASIGQLRSAQERSADAQQRLGMARQEQVQAQAMSVGAQLQQSQVEQALASDAAANIQRQRDEEARIQKEAAAEAARRLAAYDTQVAEARDAPEADPKRFFKNQTIVQKIGFALAAYADTYNKIAHGVNLGMVQRIDSLAAEDLAEQRAAIGRKESAPDKSLTGANFAAKNFDDKSAQAAADSRLRLEGMRLMAKQMELKATDGDKIAGLRDFQGKMDERIAAEDMAMAAAEAEAAAKRMRAAGGRGPRGGIEEAQKYANFAKTTQEIYGKATPGGDPEKLEENIRDLGKAYRETNEMRSSVSELNTSLKKYGLPSSSEVEAWSAGAPVSEGASRVLNARERFGYAWLRPLAGASLTDNEKKMAENITGQGFFRSERERMNSINALQKTALDNDRALVGQYGVPAWKEFHRRMNEAKDLVPDESLPTPE